MIYERSQETLRKRAQRAIIENAIFDWKSAVIIALTVLLIAFGPSWVEGSLRLQWWHFLIGGAVAWLALIVSNMTDPAANAKAVADLLRHDFNPATLQNEQAQLANLQQLENMMQKAELHMDSTLTAMGTIYSQLLLVGVKDVDSGRAQRLRQDITEQVKQLEDVASSMDEVYRTRS